MHGIQKSAANPAALFRAHFRRFDVHARKPATAAGKFSDVVSRLFYGRGEILMQNSAIVRKELRKRDVELPSVSNDMQSSETLHNSLGVNYKSAALTH